MKIVIDSNRVLAAMIRGGTTREILFDRFFDFLAPDFIVVEVQKHEGRIINAAGLTKEEFKTLLALIFEHITIIPESEYAYLFNSINEEIPDEKDVSYFAVSLASNAAGIWTHDLDFNKQNKVKVFTNIDMLRISGKSQLN